MDFFGHPLEQKFKDKILTLLFKSKKFNMANSQYTDYQVVDLFCGVGGLTHGFTQEGFDVVAGFDIDDSCKFAFEYNNRSTFLKKDIRKIDPVDIISLYKNRNRKILVGCAPCQPFSNLTKKQSITSEKWNLLYEFSRLIEQVQPEIISMENVPQLKKFNDGKIFEDFVSHLKKQGYCVNHYLIFCPDYGIPQKRKRLVLLASKIGEIEIIAKTHTPNNYVTVHDTIAHLEPIEDGGYSENDLLHRSSKLSELNKQRISVTKEGGGWRSWSDDLILDCHKKETGKSYGSVYGRMKWNEPAPTMTTQCTGIGNGRFGHPQQDRAISLREAALFQTFPESYQFFSKKSEFRPTIIARHIGNAVPVRLGQVIAQSIKIHLEKHFS